ncbi:MAG: hypothetical protein ACI35O_03860 [Bacillaceae bacterium]
MIELKKRLLNNPEKIIDILEYYGFHNVNQMYSEIRCGLDDSTNSTSIRIVLNERLTANDFARDIHGDLFSLIVSLKDKELKDVIKHVKKEVGVEYLEFNRNKKIFGGFYDNIKKRNQKVVELPTYNEEELNPYLNKYNVLFMKDGIDIPTQRKFKIGVCLDQCRITVPWFNYEGSLIGIEGRYMGDYEADEVSKWYPVIAFPKSKALFGYYINYIDLQSSERIYVGESSKFCMQLDCMGIKNATAIGGSSIHKEQIKQLSWLNPKEIVMCFDEGLEEEYIQRQVEKVKLLLKYFDVKVGYIFDRNNKVIPKGSKMSPSDLGRDSFDKLINNYIEW